MVWFTELIYTTVVLGSAAHSAAVPAAFPKETRATSNITKPKVILDNDWSPAGFIPYLQALSAGWDVLALTSNTGNAWNLQVALHALATLEIGNLSCIPVYLGSDYPLLNTPGLFQAWEDVHGVLPWQGAFKPENLTAEALGSDPTSGNPRRISRAAFTEGFPNTTADTSMSAANFMTDMVRKYPGKVSIYAAGALTNVALAVRLDPDFASLAKELVIMGGYIDVNLLEVTGSVLQADISSDVGIRSVTRGFWSFLLPNADETQINLMIDPEAAKIALTAAFPSITVAGNVANQVMSTQDFLDEIFEVKNAYTELIHKYYGTEFPFWDETAAALMIDPSLALNATSFYIDVDTSYASPSYGNIHAYQEALMPRAQQLRAVNYVTEIDSVGLKRMIKQAVQYPPTCADL
ncbi:hypothetical protein LTR66_000702 [Elasticomyces elasticus]|nr:hypothetical protein LTR66_000702 [Elasticomyces elasticus]